MFSTARRKLTALYLMIIMAISISFSFVVYRMSTRELDRFSELQSIRMERRIQDGAFGNNPRPRFSPPIPFIDPQLITEVKNRTVIFLVYVNGVILLLSSVSGYFLAGKTLKPIKDMVDEQNRFISDSSHELKTPLTSLKLAFEIYLRGKKHTQKEATKIIEESLQEVNRLQKLTESLLTIASLKKSSSQATRQNVDISLLAANVISRFSPQIKDKKINIKTNFKDVIVRVNLEEFEQLISIILDNAIKYSPPKKTISITTKADQKYVYLLVKDKGEGIKKDDLQHIFERFYRADESRGKRTNGYGLGLSIAKEIIQNHGGAIVVTSSVGAGSEFKIKIPRK
jgi:two-component system, OmpR family, sensor histidine kinase CiaH